MTTRVEILNDFLAVNVKPGENFQNIVEVTGSGMVFGCRDGECGTCILDIQQGNEYLSPINEKEKTVLKNFPDAPKNGRLACQLEIAKPNGLVRVKYQ